MKGPRKKTGGQEANPEPEGILLVDKPAGITSHDAVEVARRKLHTRKVGHAGTLDPIATGLLILLVGKATKRFPTFSEYDKHYQVTMKLGEETDTGDRDGKLVAQGDYRAVTEAAIRQAFEKYRGEMLQAPPMFSSLKYKGKRLYELARKGQRVEVPPRKISIYQNTVQNIRLPWIEFHLHCSKGTYVRKLVEDMGRDLACGAHITQLKRTKIGSFDVADAVSLDRVEIKHLKNID